MSSELGDVTSVEWGWLKIPTHLTRIGFGIGTLFAHVKQKHPSQWIPGVGTPSKRGVLCVVLFMQNYVSIKRNALGNWPPFCRAESQKS